MREQFSYQIIWKRNTISINVQKDIQEDTQNVNIYCPDLKSFVTLNFTDREAIYYIYICITILAVSTIGRKTVFISKYALKYVFMYERYAKWERNPTGTSIIHRSEFQLESLGSVSRNQIVCLARIFYSLISFILS